MLLCVSSDCLQLTHCSFEFCKNINRLFSCDNLLGKMNHSPLLKVRSWKMQVLYVSLWPRCSHVYRQQMAHNAHQFHALSGFPRIIGSLDGTHIKIKRPYGDEERAYVNRHHDHSLNVQVHFCFSLSGLHPWSYLKNLWRGCQCGSRFCPWQEIGDWGHKAYPFLRHTTNKVHTTRSLSRAPYFMHKCRPPSEFRGKKCF